MKQNKKYSTVVETNHCDRLELHIVSLFLVVLIYHLFRKKSLKIPKG